MHATARTLGPTAIARADDLSLFAPLGFVALSGLLWHFRVDRLLQADGVENDVVDAAGPSPTKRVFGFELIRKDHRGRSAELCRWDGRRPPLRPKTEPSRKRDSLKMLSHETAPV